MTKQNKVCYCVQLEAAVVYLKHEGNNRAKLIFVTFKQCVQIWRNFTPLSKFWKTLAIFGVLILLLAIFWTYFGKIMYDIGQSFIVVNDPNWKHKLAIWSHWLKATNSSSHPWPCLCPVSRDLKMIPDIDPSARRDLWIIFAVCMKPWREVMVSWFASSI